MNKITDIFKGRAFDPTVDSGEYFPVFTGKKASMQKRALNALKASAEAIVPENEMKNVVFDSADWGGVTTFMWRYGREWWINLHTNGQRNTANNITVYQP